MGVEQLTSESNCESTGEEDNKTPTEEETGTWSCYPCGLSFHNMDKEDTDTNTPLAFYGVPMTLERTSPFQMAEVVATHANTSSMSSISGSPSTASYRNTMTHSTSTCETAYDGVMERLSNIPNASLTEGNGSKHITRTGERH